MQAYEDLFIEVEKSIPIDFDDLKVMIKNIERTTFEPSMLHTGLSFYRTSDDEPSQHVLYYSSSIAEAIVSSRFGIQSCMEIRRLLQTPAPNLQGWRGNMLESMLLQDIATKAFQIRSLQDDGTPLQSYEALNALSFIIQKATQIENTKMLFVPVAKNFPAVDGVIVIPINKEILYVQVTVSEARPIKYNRMKELYEELIKICPGYCHKLVFLVSDDIFDSFKDQNFVNIDGKKRRLKIDIPLKTYVGMIGNNVSGDQYDTTTKQYDTSKLTKLCIRTKKKVCNGNHIVLLRFPGVEKKYCGHDYIIYHSFGPEYYCCCCLRYYHHFPNVN